MRQSTLRYCNIFLGIVLALSMVLIVLSVFSVQRIPTEQTNPIEMLDLTVVRDGSAAPLDLTEPLSDEDAEHLAVQGHFSRDIPAGETLLMRSVNLDITLLVNGDPVFSTEKTEEQAQFQSPGNVWLTYTAKTDIRAEDEITVLLDAAYAHGAAGAVSGFFSRMATGSVDALRAEMLRASWGSATVGVLITAFGLLTLFGGCFSLAIQFPFYRSALSLAGLLMTGGLLILLNFDYISLIIPYPTLVNTLVRVCQYALPVFAALYVRSFMTGARKKLLFYVGLLTTIFLLAAVVLQMLNIETLNQLQNAGDIVIALTAGCCIYALAAERKAVKQENRTILYLLFSILPACFGGLLDAVGYIFSWPVSVDGFNIGFLFFTLMQVVIVLYSLQDAARRALKLENDLLQARISMMMSQIQPHFLYNSLTAIKQLCATDPARAEECIGSFAGYLRTNLDSIGKNASIPFAKELAHTKQYLQLEQMRFGDRVKVAYDLRYVGFSLPSLTVQPIVENAVRYGITKNRQGGTVTIFSDETDTAYIVRVSDDGVGFDPSVQKKDDERSHIGIENVRSRLLALCKGTLDIQSAPGEGTVATITIPKEEADIV